MAEMVLPPSDILRSQEDDSGNWVIIQENYRGNPRYHKVKNNGDKIALFKTIREEQGQKIFTEMQNELIGWELGKMLEIPISEVFLGNLSTKEIGLFSIWIGEREFNFNDQNLISNLSNYDKLKDLFVFDQWIYNIDRKSAHILVGSDLNNSGRLFLKGIDHGHTLNDYNGQKLQTNASLLLVPTSAIYFDGGFTSTLEIKRVVEAIEAIEDEKIDKVVDKATEIISKYNPSQIELERVNTNEQFIRMILKSRKANLRQIIERWCQTNKKVVLWS